MSDGLFVGREAELGTLHALQQETMAGAGRTAFIAGEAGSGKSALLEEFVRQVQLRHESVTVVLGRSNAQTGMGEAYLPFMEILGLLAGMASSKQNALSDNNATRLGKVARSSAKILLDFAPDIIAAFVPGASLLSRIGQSIVKETGALALLDSASGAQQSALPSELNSQKIYQQFTDLLANVSRQTPLIVILDDMHWTDAASINLFSHLSVKLRDSPVLLLGTYRGNDLAVNRGDARHPLIPALNEIKRLYGDIVIDLEAIDQQARRGFIDTLIDAQANRLDEQFRLRLFSHTNGHPLFTVELLQSFKENGNLRTDADGCWIQGEQLDWAVLPPRLEGVIEERIGRVAEPMRDVLVASSIEGLNFTAQIVAQLQDMSERDVLKCLSQELDKRHRLVKEGLTEKVGKNWLSQFSFSHVLFQQYLYKELPERQRMLLHGEVARLLENLYRDQRDAALLHLARHYDLADEPGQAAACLIRASGLAMRLGAYDEARLQLLHTMELLAKLPPDDTRDHLELDAQVALSALYRAISGWDSPEVTAASYRARELCNSPQLQHRLAPILFGLWTIHLIRLELPQALLMAREVHALAEQSRNADLLLHANFALANTLFWMGRLPAAMEALTEASQLCVQERDYIVDFGQDPGVLTLIFLGFCACLLGAPEQALQYRAQLMARAEQLAHHFTLAIALYGAATIDYHLQDLVAMRAHTDRLLQVCREYHFPIYLGLAMVYEGWLSAMTGDATAAIRQMEEGYTKWICKDGGRTTHSLYCVMLAEALIRAGQPEQALASVDRGLAVAHECTEHCYVPELHRLRAELLADQGAPPEEVEDAYRQAIEISRAQEQPGFTARATDSLARYAQDRAALGP
ncbi:ATP-binding protein [Duganella radicis]|nr:AAA family ATPase [Duganella radicis]